MLNNIKKIYIGFLIGVTTITVFTIYLLKSNQLLMNIEEINNYNQIEIQDEYSDNNKLKTILPKIILKNNSDFITDINKTLNYVANVIDGRYISNLNLTAYQKLNNIITQNGGGICGDLAMILKEILETKGYEARTIQLIREIGTKNETHVVVEVFYKKINKFILIDPTFNLMFKSNDEYINANELRNILLYNKKKKLNILDYSNKKIPKYKDYYVDYFSLYNNILLVRNNKLLGYKRLISKLPIIHNYLGRKYFIKGNNHIKGFGSLYNSFYFYIPIIMLFNILFLIVFRRINSNKREI